MIKDILESYSNSADDEDPIRYDRRLLTQLPDIYKSCMDEDALDMLSTAPLAQVTNQLRHVLQEHGFTRGVLYAKQLMGKWQLIVI